MKISFYNKEMYDSLLGFMKHEYPNRDTRYLEWWLANSSAGSEEQMSRSFVVKEEDNIIACTTANWTKMYVDGCLRYFYWAANTIVDPSFRGKGVGRMMYEQMDMFLDRCSIGFTDSAFKIQFKVLKNLKHISDVRVYLSFTRHCIRLIQDKISGRNLLGMELRTQRTMKYKGIVAEYVNSEDDFKAPEDGIWMGDDVELVRDKEYIAERFFRIFRDYSVYQMYDNAEVVGYFVVRRARYSGMNILSLVDYRVKDQRHGRTMMRFVTNIANKNRLGVVITLTSQKDFAGLYPLTLKTPKILHGGTTIPQIKDGQAFLITSADADLDFVYYK